MTTFINTAARKAFANAVSLDTYIIDSDIKIFSLGGSTGSNGDVFAFDGFAADYKFAFKAGVLTITNPDIAGFKARIKLAPSNGATASLKFADGDLTATVSKLTGKAATLAIGGQKVTSRGSFLSDSVLASLSGDGSAPIIEDGPSSSDFSQTFILTDGVDAGAAFTGRAGNDTFNAADGTLNILDQLNGGNGSDTLNLVLTTDTLTPTSLVGIETLNIANDGGSALSLVNATGVTAINSLAATGGTLTLNNLSTSTAVTISDTSQTHVLDYDSVVGLSDTINVTVANVTSATLTVDAGIETISLTSSSTPSGSANSLTTAFAGAITVAGGTALSLSATSSDSVIASAMTASLTVDAGNGNNTIAGGSAGDLITAGTGDDSLSGGGADDTFVLAGNLTAADTVSGGSGTADTITVSATVADAAFANVTAVESLTVSGASNATLAALAAAAGIRTLADSGASANIFTIDAGYTGAVTVNISGGGADSVVNTANVALTVQAEAADITASDSIAGGSATDIIELTADNDGTGAVFGSSVTAIEQIVVRAALVAASDIKITTNDANVASGATLAVTASALTDAGAFMTFVGSAEADGKFSITGGAGNDVITGGAGNDSILGGAGTDTIVGGAGVDSLTGGAAADEFGFSDADVDTTAGIVTDAITDFGTTVDSLNFVTAGSGANYVEQLAAAGSFTDFLVAAGAALDGTVKYYFGVVGSNGFLVFDDDGVGYTSVIQLTGVTDMASSDIT